MLPKTATAPMHWRLLSSGAFWSGVSLVAGDAFAAGSLATRVASAPPAARPTPRRPDPTAAGDAGTPDGRFAAMSRDKRRKPVRVGVGPGVSRRPGSTG
jgi:hypothetical protein